MMGTVTVRFDMDDRAKGKALQEVVQAAVAGSTDVALQDCCLYIGNPLGPDQDAVLDNITPLGK